MSIYSMNRTGSDGIGMIAANENYKPVDLARVMYESQVNDQAIFESILACDFNELKATQEGTLLENEIATLNQESSKKLIEKLKERLEGFWAKLKAAFEAATQWLAAYIMKDGKAFAERFERLYKDKKFEGTIDNVHVRTDWAIKVPTRDEMEKTIRDKFDEKVKATEIAGMLLGDLVGESSCTPKEYAKKAMEKAFELKSVGNAEVPGMLAVLKNASTSVKTLTRARKETSDQIAAVVKVLKAGEKDHTQLHNLTALASACETTLTCTTRASIQAVKQEVKSARFALGKMMAAMNKEDKAVAESAVMADMDAFDASQEEPEMDAETKAAVDEIIMTTDAEVAAECKG